jgi:ribonuclease HII
LCYVAGTRSSRLGRSRVAPLSLAQIKLRYVVEGRPLDAATEAALRSDPRSGAKAILSAIESRRFENRSEGQRLRQLNRYETVLWAKGIVHVAGVDEAGMSPLAGHVAAAAVILAPGCRFTGIDDSKKLDAPSRTRLAAEIKRTALAFSVGFVDVAEIDTLNIYWAGILAMRRAVEGLSIQAQHLLVDARRIKGISTPQQPIVGGDGKSMSIAAASILAKTARDALMEQLDTQHPGYGFAKHKGYPVPEHLSAMRRLGVSAVHRRSFGPVRDILGLPPLPPWPKAADVNS